MESCYDHISLNDEGNSLLLGNKIKKEIELPWVAQKLKYDSNGGISHSLERCEIYTLPIYLQMSAKSFKNIKKISVHFGYQQEIIMERPYLTYKNGIKDLLAFPLPLGDLPYGSKLYINDYGYFLMEITFINDEREREEEMYVIYKSNPLIGSHETKYIWPYLYKLYNFMNDGKDGWDFRIRDICLFFNRLFVIAVDNDGEPGDYLKKIMKLKIGFDGPMLNLMLTWDPDNKYYHIDMFSQKGLVTWKCQEKLNYSTFRVTSMKECKVKEVLFKMDTIACIVTKYQKEIKLISCIRPF